MTKTQLREREKEKREFEMKHFILDQAALGKIFQGHIQRYSTTFCMSANYFSVMETGQIIYFFL